MRPVEKIVSGGQTGVDRAALDVALELGCDRGGWCPRGRKAEDGPIAETYPLQETPSAKYAQRTRWNVRDSDGTLILAVGPLQGGTALTCRAADESAKPCLVIDLLDGWDVQRAANWIRENQIATLNVAGPRESQQLGIGQRAIAFLRELFAALGCTNS